MIYFRKGTWKYQTTREAVIQTTIKGHVVSEEYYSLDLDGTLTVRKGYAWDGASGPTFDTESTYTPSLCHDAMCQMLNRRQIPFSRETQRAVHDFFKVQLLERGMWAFRAWYWHRVVIAADAGNPEHWRDDDPEFTAP